MIAIYVRALCELSLAGIPVAVSLVTLGQWGEIHQFNVAGWSCGAGAAIGLTQVLVSRTRRGDLFWLHRPISRAGLYALEACAGLTIALVLLFALRWGTAFPQLSGWLFQYVFLAGSWSLVWFSLGGRSIVLGVLSLPVVLLAGFGTLVLFGKSDPTLIAVGAALVIVSALVRVYRLAESVA